jgi:hypothetical protein
VKRILFSGGRRHDDPALIGARLDLAADGDDDVTLVHGRCDPRNTDGGRIPWDRALAHPEFGPFYGGDWHAHHHAVARGWTIEAVPAEWALYGSKAGGIRNQAMVNRGADQMVAAPVPGQSTGTYDAMRRAKAAGIPVDDISLPVPAQGLW